MAVKIKENRQKFDKLKKELAEANKNKPKVNVGIMGKEAKEKHKGSEFSNVDIATVHEFGTDTIPERSFIRSTYDRDQKRFFEILKRYKLKMAQGQMDAKMVLTFVGEFAQKQIQQTITDGGIPFIENTPETVRRKGSSSPLIDTGQMRQSVRYEVVNAK